MKRLAEFHYLGSVSDTLSLKCHPVSLAFHGSDGLCQGPSITRGEYLFQSLKTSVSREFRQSINQEIMVGCFVGAGSGLGKHVGHWINNLVHRD